MSRKVLFTRRGSSYAQGDIGLGNTIRIPVTDATAHQRRFQPRITEKAQQSLAASNFLSPWPASVTYLSPQTLTFTGVMSVFSGYYMASPVGDPPVSIPVLVTTIGLKPGVPGLRLVRGYNITVAGDGGVDPPKPSTNLLGKLAETVLGHVVKTTSIFKNTVAKPGNLVRILGATTLGPQGLAFEVAAQLLMAFLENLKGNPSDSLQLGDWVLIQNGETLGPDSFQENKLYTGIPEAKDEDNQALNYLKSILSDIAAIAAGATFTRLSAQWRAVVGAIKMARSLFETLCDMLEMTPDWDMPDQTTIESITDMNVLRGYLQDIMGLINDLILMIPPIRGGTNRDDDPFYCIDEETGQLKRMSCIIGGSSGGSSGWTEEMINKVFVSPDVDESYFKFSGGAIQAPWTMPE